VTVPFATLRSQHPTLRYLGHSIERRGTEVKVTFHLRLDPSIDFNPTLTFNAPGVSDERLDPFLFNLGMVETISYWKASCPPKVLIENRSLSEEQTSWWHDLFIHGLGEFFFQNDIDPSDPKLLTIESNKSAQPSQKPHTQREPRAGELILAAGGKDSSLSLELLKTFAPSVRREALILNPTRSSTESVRIAGYAPPITVTRTIDKNLLSLNANGYLNGHTPFSAYLAFLGAMIADIRGLGSVIVSNEQSANEGNATFHGLTVNHPYSKGLRFERRFREYAARELPGCASYYSLIRPLFDLQVSALFARMGEAHLLSFRSCNVGQREDRWCGECPKCAFVGLTLAPFISVQKHHDIFGTNLFSRSEIIHCVEELTGVRDHKPFECVGTVSESRDALVLTLDRFSTEKLECPKGLSEVALALSARGHLPSLDQARATLRAWSDDHELPTPYATALRAIVEAGAR